MLFYYHPSLFSCAFVTKLSLEWLTKHVSETLAYPKWKEAMVEEMQILERNSTWVLTTLPKGKHTVRCDWVFTLKHNLDATIHIYKARLIAKGFTLVYGVDYFKMFSPVAKLISI